MDNHYKNSKMALYKPLKQLGISMHQKENVLEQYKAITHGMIMMPRLKLQ